MEAVTEGGVVDEHGDLGGAPVEAAGAGDQPDQGVGLEVVEVDVVVLQAGPFGGHGGVEGGRHSGVGLRIE